MPIESMPREATGLFNTGDSCAPVIRSRFPVFMRGGSGTGSTVRQLPLPLPPAVTQDSVDHNGEVPKVLSAQGQQNRISCIQEDTEERMRLYRR